MIIKEVRAILWPKYDWIPDETLIAFVDLIEAISSYVVTLDADQDNWVYNQNENHEP